MAIINKTGITNGSTIQAEHVTRAIDALSGGSTDTIVATGSFTGSFAGPLNGTAANSDSVKTVTSSDNSTHYILFGTTTSGQQTPTTDVKLTFNPSTNALTNDGSFTLTGSLNVTGSISTNVTATATSKINLTTITSSGYFAIPVGQPSNPITGSMYVDFVVGALYLYDGSTWRGIAL